MSEHLGTSWSLVASKALDVILVRYPARTGLGAVLGCALLFVSRLIEPLFGKVTSLDFSGAPWWGWLSIGVLIMHAPTIRAVFRQQQIGNDSVDQALELIDRGNFSEAERRRQYRGLIEKVTANVALNEELVEKMRQIQNIVDRD